MRLLVSGASGLIGTALARAAAASSHQIVRLGRGSSSTAADIQWSPERGDLPLSSLEGFDAVVHLAGESIAAGRWTPAQKTKIRESRVRGTTLLAESLAKLKRPPQVLISASAVGYYGDRGNETLREDSSPGTGFLADVCRQWEASAEPAARAGIRVVFLRSGIVLAKDGGALPKMVFPFRLGVGGKIGSGNQYMSWIALDDEVQAILHCIQNPDVQGPVNAVGLSPATNLEFTKALGRALSRPTLFPLPAFAARLMLGEMADALLLASQRVEPGRLKASGFQFRHTDLLETLRQVLK